jgi:hypothetical protein
MNPEYLICHIKYSGLKYFYETPRPGQSHPKGHGKLPLSKFSAVQWHPQLQLEKHPCHLTWLEIQITFTRLESPYFLPSDRDFFFERLGREKFS